MLDNVPFSTPPPHHYSIQLLYIHNLKHVQSLAQGAVVVSLSQIVSSKKMNKQLQNDYLIIFTHLITMLVCSLCIQKNNLLHHHHLVFQYDPDATVLYIYFWFRLKILALGLTEVGPAICSSAVAMCEAYTLSTISWAQRRRLLADSSKHLLSKPFLEHCPGFIRFRHNQSYKTQLDKTHQ